MVVVAVAVVAVVVGGIIKKGAMNWICNCYGSTETHSFSGSIITLPSFDEKTIILR